MRRRRLSRFSALPRQRTTDIMRFSRTNPVTFPTGLRRPRLAMMSSRTRGVAVAVNAPTGGLPHAAMASPRRRYSGRKSCPQLEIQCASSTTRRETLSRPSASRKPPAPIRSGARYRKRSSPADARIIASRRSSAVISLRTQADGDAAAGEVHRRYQLACAGLDCRLERLVDVADREVHQPVARHLGWNHRLHFLAAGDALTAELEFRVRRLVRTHRLRLWAPAKHLLVEGDRLLDAPRAELGPAERVGIAHRHLTVHRATLPGRDDRATGILEGGHPALVSHVERRRNDLSTRGLYLLGQGVDIIGGDIDRPRGRRVR